MKFPLFLLTRFSGYDIIWKYDEPREEVLENQEKFLVTVFGE